MEEPRRVSYILQQRQKRKQEITNYKVGETNKLDDQQVKQKRINKEEESKDLLKSKAGMFQYGEEDKTLYQRRPIAYEGEVDENGKRQQPQVDSPKEIQMTHQHIHQRSNKDVFMPFDEQYGFANKQFEATKQDIKNAYQRDQTTYTDEQLKQIRTESRKMYKRNKQQTRTDDLF